MRANLVRNFSRDFISLYLSRLVRITAKEINNYFIRLSNEYYEYLPLKNFK